MTNKPALITRLTALLAMLGLLVGGCDSGGPGDRAEPDGDGSGSRSTASGAPDDESGSTWSSPLNDFLSLASQVDEDEVERRQRAYNDAVIACMAAEGFDYTPPDEDNDLQIPGTRPWDLPRDEFVVTYGYGITTSDGEQAAPDFQDPNQGRLDAMSPAERTAYHRALHGGAIPLTEDGYPNPEPIQIEAIETRDPGCAGQAGEQVYGGVTNSDQDAFAQFDGLLDDIAQIHARVVQDPQVVDAHRAWSDCMADAGHPFDGPDDPRSEIQSRVLALAGGTGDVLTTDGLAAREVLMFRGSFEDVDPEALEALRAYELEVAAVDHACAQEHELERIEREVRTELENRFIEDNRAELEAYRDLIASGAGGVG